MTPIHFTTLQPDLKTKYNDYYRKSESELTDLTFNCRFAWDVVFKNEVAFIEDCLVMISDGGCFTQPHMLMPMGDLNEDNLNRIIEQMIPVFKERNWPFRIMAIDESKVDLFDKLSGYDTRFCFNNSFSDYLYKASKLRTLSSPRLRKKRNHINRFMRNYPHYNYARMTAGDADDCLALVRKWSDDKGIDINDYQNSDYHMIARLFKHFDALDVHGGVIRIGTEVAAFSMGSIGNPNRAYIHFEKADTSIDGAYPAINQLVLQNEFSNVTEVNREEDLGIPGLRKSKRSYYPIKMIKKYTCQIEIQ